MKPCAEQHGQQRREVEHGNGRPESRVLCDVLHHERRWEEGLVRASHEGLWRARHGFRWVSGNAYPHGDDGSSDASASDASVHGEACGAPFSAESLSRQSSVSERC